MKLKWSKAIGLCSAIAIPCAVGASVAVLLHAHTTSSKRAAAPATDAATVGPWLDDLRVAQSLARSRGKDILLEFSPSTDDASAVGLENRCLDSTPFREAASKSFVLVRLNASGDISPARATQITAFAERLGVIRFPTLILLDTDGKPYAKTDVMLADPIAMGAELDKCHGVRLVRDVALAAAGATNGAERAKHLDAALTAVAKFVDPEYADVVQQLIAADPTNVTGLRAKYEPAALARRADAAVQNEIYPLIDRGEYPAAIARIDRLIGEINPRHEQLQLLLAFKGQLYFTLGDKHRAAEFLDSAIAVNPTSESAGRARAARAQILGGS